MSNITLGIMLYILISLLIGSYYFEYWYKTLQPKEVLYSTKPKRIFIYSAVIIMSACLLPITLIDLYKINKKRKGEKQ